MRTARAMEPALSRRTLIAAFAVQDGAVDPFMLSLDNIAQAIEPWLFHAPQPRRRVHGSRRTAAWYPRASAGT